MEAKLVTKPAEWGDEGFMLDTFGNRFTCTKSVE